MKRGFTLLELLVVIAIIGILSSVVLASLNSARSGGRDAARQQAIREIEKVLEMYYLENGEYPESAICTATQPNGSWCNSVESLSGGHWIANGALSDYFSSDPVDPNPVDPATAWSTNVAGVYFYYSNKYTDGDTGESCSRYTLTTGYEDTSNYSDDILIESGNCTAGGIYLVMKSVTKRSPTF